MKIKQISAIKIAMVACVIFCFCVLLLKPNMSTAHDTIDFDEIGNAIDSSIENLLIANSDLRGIVAYNDSDVVLTVNGVPLTQQELTFRKNVIEASPPPHKLEQEILDTLIREKVELSIALEHNMLPTENEVQTFIQWEKNIEGQRLAAEKFCDNSNLTLDEYWNVYECYNVMRMLISKNIFQLYLDQNNITEDYNMAALSEDIHTDFLDVFNGWVSQADIIYMDSANLN